MCSPWLLLLWALLPGAAAEGSGRTFPHRTPLDSEGKYWLSWGPRDARLAFRLEVRTAGYVGFGFSPTGAMAAADIVVGGVAQGRPYLQVSSPSFPSPAGSARLPIPVPSRPVLTPERARVPGPPTTGHRDGRAAPRTLPVAISSRTRTRSPNPRPAPHALRPGARSPRPGAPRPAPSFRPAKLSTVTPGRSPLLNTSLSPAPGGVDLLLPPATCRGPPLLPVVPGT